MSDILEPEDTPKSAKELVDKGWVEFIGYGASNIPIYRVVRSFKRPMWYAEGQTGANTMTYDRGDWVYIQLLQPVNGSRSGTSRLGWFDSTSSPPSYD